MTRFDHLCRKVAAAMIVAASLVEAHPAHGQDKPATPAQEKPSSLGELAPSAAPGTHGVTVIDETWRDESRKRDVPVRVFLPRPIPGEPEDGKHPVIVFSHGLGGSRTSYPYFGNHMASQGYIVVAPTHAGSDTVQAMTWFKEHGGMGPGKADKGNEQRPLERLRERAKERQEGGGGGGKGGAGGGDAQAGGLDQPGGWLMTSVNDPDNLANRPKDISFIIDQLSKNATLAPIADLDRIGVAGHSFGAYTAMAIGGMTVDLPESCGGKAHSFRDTRVKAVLPMSPEGAGSMGISKGAWDKFGVPVLFLTGTKDYGSGDRSAEWRRQGFEGVRAVDDYLVTLEGAGHMTFANMGGLWGGEGQGASAGILGGSGDPAKQTHHVEMIDALSSTFFDGYVRNDYAARQRLRAFVSARHDDCKAEFHAPARATSGPDQPKP